MRLTDVFTAPYVLSKSQDASLAPSFALQSWKTKHLTLFEALQLIVSRRSGESVANALKNYSPKARLGLLNYRDDEGDKTAAFERAENELENWCKQGLIEARGTLVFGRQKQKKKVNTDLAKFWCNSMKFDFFESAVNGTPTFTDILLKTENIEALLNRSITEPPRRERAPLRPSDFQVRAIVAKRHEDRAKKSLALPTYKEDAEAVLSLCPGARRNQIVDAREPFKPSTGWPLGPRKKKTSYTILPQSTAGGREK